MITLPVLDSHAPPVRVMALHALAYCPRLFYHMASLTGTAGQVQRRIRQYQALCDEAHVGAAIALVVHRGPTRRQRSQRLLASCRLIQQAYLA